LKEFTEADFELMAIEGFDAQLFFDENGITRVTWITPLGVDNP